MGQLLKLLLVLGLSGSVASAAAAGSWNGVSFTAWNAIAITAWNGTAIATTTTTTLNTSLISYWKLDEASGTRVDSEPTGTPQDLADNGSTVSTTGKINSAGQFTAASNQFLNRSDSADLSVGDIDFTLACWVYLDTKPSEEYIVSKGTGEYYIRYKGSTDRFEATFEGSVVATANTLGSPSTATWYLVIAWHDSVNNLVGISVNAGTADTTSWSSGVSDGTSVFNIGTVINNTSFDFDGRIDEVGFWKKVLTGAERTELYNAGAGKTCCPF